MDMQNEILTKIMIQYKSFIILPSLSIFETSGYIEIDKIENKLKEDNLLAFYSDDLKSMDDKSILFLFSKLFYLIIDFKSNSNIEKIMWIRHNKNTKTIEI